MYSEYASKFSRSPASVGGMFGSAVIYARKSDVLSNVFISVFDTGPFGAIINPKMFI